MAITVNQTLDVNTRETDGTKSRVYSSTLDIKYLNNNLTLWKLLQSLAYTLDIDTDIGQLLMVALETGDTAFKLPAVESETFFRKYTILNKSTKKIIISPDTGVTIIPQVGKKLTSLGKGSKIEIMQTGTNEWYVSGDLEAL